jgi:hypothetical protein
MFLNQFVIGGGGIQWPWFLTIRPNWGFMAKIVNQNLIMTISTILDFLLLKLLKYLLILTIWKLREFYGHGRNPPNYMPVSGVTFFLHGLFCRHNVCPKSQNGPWLESQKQKVLSSNPLAAYPERRVLRTQLSFVYANSSGRLSRMIGKPWLRIKS